jgi:hypothetical protein
MFKFNFKNKNTIFTTSKIPLRNNKNMIIEYLDETR